MLGSESRWAVGQKDSNPTFSDSPAPLLGVGSSSILLLTSAWGPMFLSQMPHGPSPYAPSSETSQVGRNLIPLGLRPLGLGPVPGATMEAEEEESPLERDQM